LIVPDGSWRQARKAVVREPDLASARKVMLPAGGPPSEYQLRAEPDEQSVCTYEAVARAFGVLEGAQVQVELERLFRVMVGRSLWARGMIQADQVPGGIPERALTRGAVPE
jgi:DTW domain-containing protein YfiP